MAYGLANKKTVIFVFSTQLTVNKCSLKVCRCLVSNRGSLVSEQTALPTETQPLSKNRSYHTVVLRWFTVACVGHRRVTVLRSRDVCARFCWPSVTRWQHEFFNILSFTTMKICPIALEIYNRRLQFSAQNQIDPL